MYRVTMLIVQPNVITTLTGRKSEFRTIQVKADSQDDANRIAADNPDWFEDDNRVIERQSI